MRLSILREFVELGNCLSFSKAANRLHLSQPALSMHISKLEQDLGVTLVRRERPMHLTAAGKLFYEHANEMLAMHEKAVAACRALDQSEERGQICIKMTYAPSAAKASFRKLVASFREAHPSIDVSFISEREGSDNLLECETSGKINVWFFPTTCENRVRAHEQAVGARSLLMSTGAVTLWMHPENELQAKDRISIRDLEGLKYPIPMGEHFAEPRESALAIAKEHGVQPAFRNVLVDSVEDYMLAVKKDDVFLMIGHPFDDRSGSFVCRLLDPPIEHRNYLIIKNDPDNPALDLFFEYLKEHWTPAVNSGE